jgi:predicted nucleotidyltransferase
MCNRNELNIILSKVAVKSKEVFGEKLDSVILYGSYARGDYDSESDIDVMIIADINTDEIRNYEELLFDYSFEMDLKYDIVLSIMIKDKKTFEQWKELPFYKNVIREGINYVA